MKLDTHFNHSRTHSKHQHTHEHKHNDNAGVSRFTNAVLHQVEEWPLLYNIIAEKDSRRIFYFMW